MKLENSKHSVYMVEIRASGKWQKIGEYAEKGISYLKAKLQARESPLHAVRVREIVFNPER